MWGMNKGRLTSLRLSKVLPLTRLITTHEKLCFRSLNRKNNVKGRLYHNAAYTESGNLKIKGHKKYL